ncbi:hypothetical protein BHM03_00003158 [Ensete ventricosum]|nr:hypothetical protein BHM03_00003158 [Ensete ventricosum]
MELQPYDGPRSSLSIGPGFGRCSGISPEFARRFVEGIRKLVGNMSGDCRKKTIGLVARMSEAAGLAGCVGSSLRVSRVCQDSIREFARRRPRLTERLSGVAEKLAGNDRPRSSLGIGLGSDDVVGSRRSLLGDSSKGSGSLLGTRREITGRRPEDSLQECWRLLDWWDRKNLREKSFATDPRKGYVGIATSCGAAMQEATTSLD